MENQNNIDEYDRLVSRFGFKYIEKCHALLCIGCKRLFREDFASHFRNSHTRRGVIMMNEEEIVLIVARFANFQSPYFSEGMPLLDAVEDMELFDGYRCHECHFYCKDKKYMSKHLKVHYNVSAPSFTSCKVQLKTVEGFRRKYFGVKDIKAKTSVHADMEKLVQATMAPIYRNSELPDETPNQQNPAYRFLGWYIGNVDDFASCRDLLQKLPKENEEGYAQIVSCGRLSEELINGVSKVSQNIRMAFSDQSLHSFGYLQCEKTRKEYANALTRFVWFLRQIRLGCTEMIKLSDETAAAMDIFWDSMELTSENFRKLLMAVIRERAVYGESISTNFLKLMAKKPGGGCYQPVSEISRLASKMIYIYKAVCVTEVACLGTSEQFARFPEFKTFVTIDNFNSFSNICYIQGVANKVSRSESAAPCVVIGSDPNTIIVKGRQLTISEFRLAFSTAVENCKRMLEMLKLGLPTILEKSKIFDDITDGGEGSRVKYGDADEDFEIRKALLEHIVSEPALTEKYISHVRDRRIVFRETAMLEYLEMYDRYIEYLFIVIHMGSGLPSRAPELLTATIEGGKSGLRSLYYLDGSLFLRLLYGKSNSRTRSSRSIARFLDEDVSSMLLEDIFFVRPLVIRFAIDLSSDDGLRYKTNLLVIDRKLLSERNLYDLFEKKFSELSGKMLNFSSYRQLAKFLGNRYGVYRQGESSLFEEEEVDSSRAHFDEQFGHGSATADEHYGISSDEPAGTRLYKITGFRETSRKWQSFVLKGKSDEKTCDGMKKINTKPNEQIISFKTDDRSLNEKDFSEKSLIILESTFLTSDAGDTAIKAMRKLFRVDDPVFSSLEQRTAIEYILSTTLDLLVILPTGGGKSILFFARAAYGGGTVLVIVPMLSLIEDLEIRARGFNLSTCADYTSFNGQKILFATPESAFSSSFRGLIRQLVDSKLLSKIFVDEAHLFCTDSGYRRSFLELEYLCCLTVPIILLTATAPKWITTSLCNDFFGEKRTPVIIRANTSRPNLKFIFCEGGVDCLVDFCTTAVESLGESGRIIIYVTAKNHCQFICEQLSEYGIEAEIYNGERDELDNSLSFQRWREGSVKLMVATTAFGIGIDYNAVRYVISYGLPFSLEVYMQQGGRAGRDGLESSVIVFFERKKEAILNAKRIGQAREDMEKMLFLATVENVCRRRILSRYFDQTEIDCRSRPNTNLCDNCTKTFDAEIGNFNSYCRK